MELQECVLWEYVREWWKSVNKRAEKWEHFTQWLDNNRALCYSMPGSRAEPLQKRWLVKISWQLSWIQVDGERHPCKDLGGNHLGMEWAELESAERPMHPELSERGGILKQNESARCTGPIRKGPTSHAKQVSLMSIRGKWKAEFHIAGLYF